ncbi:MAG: hypothetical protein ACE5E1_02215 [Phycisphaerae bacterium]
MTRLRTAVLAALCATAAAPVAASAGVKVGDKAPPLKVGQWMNLPEGMSKLSLSDLKGQIVMVEFWATW